MYLTADFGATNTRVASSKDLKSIHKIEKFETNNDFEKQVGLLKRAFEAVSNSGKIKGVCIGLPGILDQEEKKIIRVVNCPGMENKAFSELLPEGYKDVLLYVENDAALAGLGEAVFGAGKNFDVVAYLTLSTGVGGARVSKEGKKISYFSAEPGHHIILEDGRLNEKSGLFGSLESYCSGTSFKEIFGADPKDCEDTEAWDVYAKHLSTGLVNIIAFWNPQVIVLGGGMSNQFGRFFEPLMKYLSKQSFFHLPEIKKSELSDEAGIYGGFAYLKDCL